MSLSNNNNGQASNMFILKPVSSKDGEKVRPYFELSKSENGKWVVQEDQTINNVTGDLYKIEAYEEEYKGDKYFRVRIYLKDNESNESYLVPCRMNIATRSLFNSLFSLKSFSGVSIRYYQTKSGYEAFYVSQNDEKVKWKYESEELPSPQEVTFKGKTIRDFSDVDKFFVEQISVLNARISGKEDKESEDDKEPEASVEVKVQKTKAKKVVEEDLPEDVQF